MYIQASRLPIVYRFSTDSEKGGFACIKAVNCSLSVFICFYIWIPVEGASSFEGSGWLGKYWGE